MPLKLAILGIDTFQLPWLHAVAELRALNDIQLVAIGHPATTAARDLADFFKSPAHPKPIPTFDDPRKLLQETAPQIILLDRPANLSLDFLLTCAAQNVGIFSLGPPIQSLAEAQALADALEPRTHLLHIWPHFADSPAARRCAQAEDFLRPIRFASASWLGINHALAAKLPKNAAHSPLTTRHAELPDLPVRSLTVLAWDLLGTLIALMGLPTSVYAAIRGTVGNGSNFADISGAAAVTLRFADDAAASLTLCDRAPAAPNPDPAAPDHRRDLLLWGGASANTTNASGTANASNATAGGATLRITSTHYEFRDPTGTLIDSSLPNQIPSPSPSLAPTPARTPEAPPNLFTPIETPLENQIETPIENQKSKMGGENLPTSPAATLRAYLAQYALPPSPHRGTPHLLTDIAATLEALIVSHRTGQPESPDRLRQLRR